MNSIARIYKPKENDYVIGIVVVRTPDFFLVDINSPELAILPMTAFDNGRTPSRQAMNRLSIVYAWVVCADPWIQTELSCQTWGHATKKSNFGLLEYGNVLRCSVELCKKLQHSQLIGHFNRIVKDFHIRITKNGFVWYTTETMNSMVAVRNVIYKHEFEDNMENLIDFYKILIDKLEQIDK